MRFEPSPLEGCFVLHPERREDDRGFFARVFCVDELRANGLETRVHQASISFSARRGTLRGMHYQRHPHEEVKVVRCSSGAIFDVAVDLRRESRTFRQWFGVELNAKNRCSVYLPRGVAHGLLTLTDAAEVLYLISDPQVATAATGIRWNDPAIGIRWPFEPSVIAERDTEWPLLD